MQKENKYSKLLSGKSQLEPYPMENLKRVDKPTTLITNQIKRFDEREMSFARMRRGDSDPASNIRPFASGSANAISTVLMSALNSVGTPQRIPPFATFMDRQRPPVPPIPGITDMSEMLRNVPSTPSREGGETGIGMGDIAARMRQMMAVMSGEPAPEKAVLPNDPSILSRHIKSMSYFVGADIVGICELPQWAVYSHDLQGNPVECDHKYAICIVVDQGRETMDASNGNDWISAAQSGRGYAMCGFIGNILANYIRMLGYPARLHSIRGYQVLVPPLLLLSGVGEMSRANIVLNPFLGLRFKASVVTTNLPLEPDKPVDFGLQDFCNKCKKCSVECPSKSISTGEKVIKNGYERWEFNSETCTKYRFGNPKGVSCGRCIKVCPWNKPQGWTHDLVRWMINHTPFMNSFIINMDDVWGYGKPNKDKIWWFDS